MNSKTENSQNRKTENPNAPLVNQSVSSQYDKKRYKSWSSAFDQPRSQSIRPSTCQSVYMYNVSVNQSISQSINQSISQSIG